MRRQSKSWNRKHSVSRAIVLCSAVAGVVGYQHVANATTFVISTSGATALGAFNRSNSNADAPTTGTIVRGPFTVGQNGLQIGNTTYNLGVGAVYFGVGNPSGTISGEPSTSQDQVLYYYRESGSVQGMLDLLDSNGLLVASGGNNLYPNNPGANLYLWANGTRFTAPNTTGTPSGTGRTIGQTDPGRLTSTNGQPLVHMAWSDVRWEQAVAINQNESTGTYATNSDHAYNKSPLNLGYGLGNGNVGGTNFQALRNNDSIVGGVSTTTERLRGETTSITPFNLVANPGTGLGQITKNEAAWLQMTGRLPNGANFNSITREIGSGTRNQGDLNLGLDPSWGSGERDRHALTAYDTTDINGNAVHVNIGDEADPTLDLNGNIQDANENRIGPKIRFADKISGGSGVRALVSTSRMGVGILSGGDSRSGSAGTALTGNPAVAGAPNNTTSVPMRALAIDWGGGTYTQATVFNVTHGNYQMWTSSQALTVAPYANPVLNDATYTTRPILNDQREVGGTTISTSTTSFAANGNTTDPGLMRKFIDNITQSVATYNPAGSEVTPADFLMTGGFILPQIMSVTKNFDGDTSYGSRTPDTTIYNAAASGPGGVMYDQTNWADPHKTNGGLGSATKYNIFASANNAIVGATQNRSITVTSRTVLAGDFDGDGVRDLADTPAVAFAYANPTAYLATPASGDVNGRNYNGVAVLSTSAGTNAAAADGLIVLSDFNSNGNVTVDANNATFATKPIERSDVRYFLYGATVDTSAYNSATSTTLNGSSYSLTATENRRENGVRLGQLKKNAAIDTFNTTLNGYVGTVTNPDTALPFTQNEINTLKFNKFDVNGDNQVTRSDAAIVDRNIGKNYTNLSDVLSTRDDLVAAEFQDDGSITFVDPDGAGPLKSDFQMIRAELTSTHLLDGDTNFDGRVDILDIYDLASHWNGSVDRWSKGDFDFNGVVNSTDLSMLALNWQGSAALLGQDLSAFGLNTAVPEPVCLGLLPIGLLLARRRRRAR